jgi:hypothetical protein
MRMIDVYSTGRTFAKPKALARDLPATLMEIEQIPGIPVFARTRRHSSTTVRTARDKLLAIVCQSTDLVAAAAGNPSLAGWTWSCRPAN